MGLDIHRFIGEVLEDFRCPVCHDIVEDPISTQCEHIFCKICINKSLENRKICPVDRKPLNSSQLIEPSRFFRNIYSKLMIKCEFESNGCKKIWKIEELICHQNKCKFNPIVKSDCENGCGAMLTINELMKHNCVQYLKSINLTYKEQLIKVNKSHTEQEKSLKDLQDMFSKQTAEMEKLKAELEKSTVIESKQSTEIEKCKVEIKKVTDKESKQNFLIKNLQKSLTTKCELINELTKKNKNQSELLSKMMEEIQVEAKVEGPGRSKATFQFKIENFSKLSKTIFSSPIYVRNLPWTIEAVPKCEGEGENQKKSLGVYLQCDEDKLKKWSCNATAELRIISQREGTGNYSLNYTKHNFTNESSDWGYANFMDWNNVLDPEKGYIKNDTIVLEVEFSADEPNIMIL